MTAIVRYNQFIEFYKQYQLSLISSIENYIIRRLRNQSKLTDGLKNLRNKCGI